MRLALGIAAVALACAPAGCGTSDRDQVRAKVEQFARAAAAKDYKTICEQVLAPSLLAHLSAGGIGCEQAMKIGLGPVHNPTVAIGKVTIHGSHASVLAISSAYGQEASLQAIELIKTGAGWRITSLGSPVVPGQ